MNELLFEEKYRPKKVADCILPDNLKSYFQKIVDSGTVPNMTLAGSAGTGKTTVARAICSELGLDCMEINCSEDSGIDVLRNKIRQFASSFSLTGGLKVVILDEADYLNLHSTQPALRGFTQEFSSNCRFILTCNFKNRLIEPLLSRCPVVEFQTSKKILAQLSAQFMKRCRQILDDETIEYHEKTLAELIMKFAPDWRRILNTIQRYSQSGELATAALSENHSASMNQLFEYLEEKEFRKMRTWVSQNSDLDCSSIFKQIYDSLNQRLDPQSIPNIILILAEWEYKSAFMADHELAITACLTEIMANAKFK
jgi:DNA polymerase III delta prime subunit